MVYWPFGDESLADHPLGIALANTVAFGVVLYYAHARSGTDAVRLFGLRPMPGVAALPVVVATFGFVILLSEVDNVFRTFVPLPEEAAEAFADLVDIEESLLATL